jgi:hypothetical protein
MFKSFWRRASKRKSSPRMTSFRPQLEGLEERAVPAFVLAGRFGVGTAPFSVAVADINHDGFLDAVTANRDSDDVSALLGDGTGHFTLARTLQLPPGNHSPVSVAVGDLDGTGWLDIATANPISDSVTVWVGDSAGNYVPTSYDTGRVPDAVKIADTNGDGLLDVITPNSLDSTLTVLRGNGHGSLSLFETPSVSQFDARPADVMVGDFNGDLIPDIATANSLNNTVSILLGDSSGRHGTTNLITDGGGTDPAALAAADFNGDGHIDIAVANYNTANVTVLFGNGAGQFTDGTSGLSTFGQGSAPTSLAVGDFNGDGKMDLATADPQGNVVSVQYGDGAGGFAHLDLIPTGSIHGAQPWAVAAADVNHDGRADLIVTNRFESDIVVLLSQPDAPAPATSAVPHTAQFEAHVRQKKGAFVVEIVDAAGAVRLTRRFHSRVQVLRRDLNGDGVDEIILQFRQGHKHHRLVLNGIDLSRVG